MIFMVLLRHLVRPQLAGGDVPGECARGVLGRVIGHVVVNIL